MKRVSTFYAPIALTYVTARYDVDEIAQCVFSNRYVLISHMSHVYQQVIITGEHCINNNQETLVHTLPSDMWESECVCFCVRVCVCVCMCVRVRACVRACARETGNYCVSE